MTHKTDPRAHTQSHLRSLILACMYAHICMCTGAPQTLTHTHVLTHANCVYNHAYVHAHAYVHSRIQIQAHAHASTYTSGYIPTVCCTLPHTYSCSRMHACSLMHARSCSNICYAHLCTHSCLPTLVHAHSPSHALAYAHTLAHAHTHASRKHLNPSYIYKHTPKPVGIHWQPSKYSFHLGA